MVGNRRSKNTTPVLAGSRRTPETSTLSARNVRSTKSPIASGPTRPTQLARWPNRASAIATLDSAPAMLVDTVPPVLNMV
jgi:hypothetical protein